MTEHWEVLPEGTANTWSLLQNVPLIEQLYLAGGTGLALHIGHRISRDLDFFAERRFDVDALIQIIKSLGNFQLEMKDEQTVVGVLDGTKISFLGYHYPLLEKDTMLRGVRVAAIADIACMKIDAIAGRGTKRDFIDLFYIVRDISLDALMGLFRKKYTAIGYNLMHIKKSMVYFDDAEDDPMPDMLIPVGWNLVKTFFLAEVPKLM